MAIGKDGIMKLFIFLMHTEIVPPIMAKLPEVCYMEAPATGIFRAYY